MRSINVDGEGEELQSTIEDQGYKRKSKGSEKIKEYIKIFGRIL